MKPAKRVILSLATDAGGAAAVEFALIASAFLTLIFGISYVAIMLYDKSTLQWAVEQSIRQAVIDTNVTQAQMADAVNGYLSQTGLPTVTVTYSVTQAGTIPIANLAASFSQNYTLPFVSTFHITYSASTSMPQGG
jgi:Flp pilus assembly protein TadG